MSTLKFIHAADLHIDSPMRGLHNFDADLGKQVRESSRGAFKKLVDFALAEEVAFIVVAGDIFDGDWDNVETGIWTVGQFKRLQERGILVYVAYGNHDLKNKIAKSLRFPDNVKTFDSEKPERFYFPEGSTKNDAEVALTGQSYDNEKCPRDLASEYPSAAPGAFNIGVLHTALSGDKLDVYAPTSESTLLGKGFDYWALGHVHQGRVVRERDPWIGYSGVLQARHINEAGVKGFYVVEVADGAMVGAPRFVECDLLRWVRVEVDLDGADGKNEVEKRLCGAMARAIANAGGRKIAARACLTGRTAFCNELRKMNDSNGLVDWLCLCVKTVGDVQIEKVELNVKRPRSDSEFSFGLLRSLADEFEAKDARYAEMIESGTSMSDKNADCFGDLRALDKFRKLMPKADKDVERLLRGFEKGLGVDFDSPETFRNWNRRALEMLQNAFEEE